MKKAFVLMAVCATVFSASSARAATTTTTTITIVEACAQWEGTWTFTYAGDKTETIIITDICSKEEDVIPAPDCMPGGSVKEAWLCVARGKKQSNSTTVEIRQISMDTSVYGYYEATDEEILAAGAKAPYDKISADSFANCTFTADAAKLGLTSGLKSNCAPTTTTTTVAGPCPAQKVLGEGNPDLENLRAFRDGPLARSAVGRGLTRIYYNNAASINAALDSSPALRAVARNLFEAVVPLVGNTK